MRAASRSSVMPFEPDLLISSRTAIDPRRSTVLATGSMMLDKSNDNWKEAGNDIMQDYLKSHLCDLISLYGERLH